jgi:hypothetical protein
MNTFSLSGATISFLLTITKRRFDSTKSTELRFCALLTEGDTRVRFHREGLGRLKEDMA